MPPVSEFGRLAGLENQTSFAQAEYAGKQKVTRRERFLGEMEVVVRPGGRVVLMGGVGRSGDADLTLPYPWPMQNDITVRGK